jgi:ferredoxin
MAIIITEDCINCGACEPECPNNAIYEGGSMWTMAEGTTLNGSFTLKDGTEVDAYDEQETLSEDLFFIVPDKCTECVGFHDEPQCESVCPVDCCPQDPDHEETEEELEAKRLMLHEE